MRLSLSLLMILLSGCISMPEMTKELNSNVIGPFREQIKTEMVEEIHKQVDAAKPGLEERLAKEKAEILEQIKAQFEVIQMEVARLMKAESKKITEDIAKLFNQKAAEITQALLAAKK